MQSRRSSAAHRYVKITEVLEVPPAALPKMQKASTVPLALGRAASGRSPWFSRFRPGKLLETARTIADYSVIRASSAPLAFRYARASARTKSIRSLVIGDRSSGDTLRMSLRSLVSWTV